MPMRCSSVDLGVPKSASNASVSRMSLCHSLNSFSKTASQKRPAKSQQCLERIGIVAAVFQIQQSA
jgi:hypothetical protein